MKTNVNVTDRHKQAVKSLLAWLEDCVAMETPIHFDEEGNISGKEALEGLEAIYPEIHNIVN